MPESGDDHQLARVQVEQGSDAARAMLVGELDMSNADRVYEELIAAAIGCRQLLVDLTGLDFIDSAGIAVLDRLSRALSQGSTQLRIIAPEGSVAGRTLALAGMDRVLPMGAPRRPSEGPD